MATLQEMLLGVLDGFSEIQLCIVFGSAASGRAVSGSDLDIAVAADKPLTTKRRLELAEVLSTAANQEIDLIDLMADSGPIIRQALSKGVIVKNLNKSLYAKIISRMLFNQTDMMPYYDRILRERRARFLNG